MSFIKKFNKLRRDPKLFFKDMVRKKYNPIREHFIKLFCKKKEGFSKYTVITPVYNAEKYLDDYFKSIINQRLDFKNNINIVCIDDGSTDLSAKIIKNYQKKYPENITYVYKENGGQSTARNVGLNYVSTPWFAFLDADDFINMDYFYVLDNFLFKNEQHNIVAACANQRIFHEKNKKVTEHPLSALKHNNGNQIVKISELSNVVQSSSCSIFLTTIMQNNKISFNESSNYYEDMQFGIDFYKNCSSRQTCAFLPEMIYYIRKRAEEDSTMNKAKTSKTYWLNSIQICLDSLEENKNSSIYEYVQHSCFTHIIGQVRQLVDNADNLRILDDENKELYFTLIKKCFSLIDAKIIESFNVFGNTFFYKLGILNCFKQESLPYNIAYITGYDCVKEQIKIQYYSAVEQNIEEFYFDDEIVCADYEKVMKHTFLDRVFCYEKICWVHVPANAKHTFSMSINNEDVYIGWKNSHLSIGYIRNKFKILDEKSDIWLFFDRDVEADDNAERLYRYVMNNKLHNNIYFALNKDSPDWNRLKKEGFNLVEAYSREFHKIAKEAVNLISSHTPQGMHIKREYWQRFIFLGHGVDVQNLSSYFNRLNITLRTSSTRTEINNILRDDSNYLLTKKELVLTGQARHDRLLSVNKLNTKNILIMFTWRSNLVKERDITFDRDVVDDFSDSLYWKSITSLLSSKRLEDISKTFGYNIVFVPHFNMKAMMESLEVPPYIKTFYREGNEPFQNIFANADLMITDYTSAAFEMAYLKKPVLYYQFDEEEFFSSHTYKKGFYDYRKDGFGPVVIDENELFDELEKLLANNCQVEGPYLSNIKNTFEFQDGKCCERIYNAIIDLDKPYEANFNLEYILRKAKDAINYKCWGLAALCYKEIIENSSDPNEDDILSYLYASDLAGNASKAAHYIMSLKCDKDLIISKYLISGCDIGESASKWLLSIASKVGYTLKVELKEINIWYFKAKAKQYMENKLYKEAAKMYKYIIENSNEIEECVVAEYIKASLHMDEDLEMIGKFLENNKNKFASGGGGGKIPYFDKYDWFRWEIKNDLEGN